jgi:winged helix-turn-helix protein
VSDPRLAQVRGISALGDALGYYRELAVGGLTPVELAARTISSERFAREWLARQADRGHIDYEPRTGRYSLNDRQSASIWDWNNKGESP